MIAPRSSVFRTSPIEASGALRESMVSLIVRTAAINDVTPATFISRKIAEGTSSSCLRYAARLVGPSLGQTINGSSQITDDIVTSMERLTLLTGLSASTTKAFAPISTINGLLRQGLAWSSGVLAQSNEPHFPLLWALEPVRACLKTRQPLQSICPHCCKPLLGFTGAMVIGRCGKCGGNLAESAAVASKINPLAAKIRDLDYEVWVAEQLGRFIQSQSKNPLPANFSYSETLQHWFQEFGIVRPKQLTECLGTTAASYHGWIGRKSIPRLRTTLNICWIFQLSLHDFLFRRRPENHDGKFRASIDNRHHGIRTGRRYKIDRHELESTLFGIIRNDLYPMDSFTDICTKRIKRREQVVRQYFPELARQIAGRYQRSRRDWAIQQKASYIAVLKETARFLSARGIVPNHKTLRSRLPNPGKLMCDYARQALHEVRVELGYYAEGEQLELPIQ